MEIKRDAYLKKLLDSRNNGLVKIVTGIRRCGKSYLLTTLFHNELRNEGVPENHIIEIPLDMLENESLLDKKNLYEHIKSLITDKEMYYIILDEIQKVPGFEGVLNSLMHFPNVDLYVTGSNSKFLSSDIITEFRGRGDEIRIYPLTFSEFLSAYNGSERDAWHEYYTFGGLPLILSMNTEEKKAAYLKQLLNKVYLDDVVERNKIRKPAELGIVFECLASAEGSLVNTKNISNSFKSKMNVTLSDDTIKFYTSCFQNAFIMEKASRFDIKGKEYIGSLCKYYFSDVGLRNALLNFRQQEESHIMENIIYNELKVRGYNVDVGIVEVNAKNKDNQNVRRQLEIDFVCNQSNRRYYIQSALNIDSPEKELQEEKPLISVNDSFKKIIVVRDDIKTKCDDNGITTMGLHEFLLNKDSLSI